MLLCEYVAFIGRRKAARLILRPRTNKTLGKKPRAVSSLGCFFGRRVQHHTHTQEREREVERESERERERHKTNIHFRLDVEVYGDVQEIGEVLNILDNVLGV